MKDIITEENVREYVRVGGDYCPFCRSPEVVSDGFLFYEEEFVKVYKPMICLTCLKDWTDVFSLTSIKEMLPESIEAEIV